MPLDVTSLSLRDQLAMAGITPVSMAVLEAHKTAQLHKHRRSLLAAHWPYLLVGLSAAVAYWVTRTVRMPISDVVFAVIMLGVITFMSRALIDLVCLITGTKLLGHPQWTEYTLVPWNDPLPVPELILEVMQRAKLVQGKLLYGQLVQNEVVLDPYLVVQGSDGRYCLGIWENDEVIACATLD